MILWKNAGTIKLTGNLNFLLLLLLNQTFTKNNKGEKSNQKSFIVKSHYYYIEPNQHLCQRLYEYEKKKTDDEFQSLRLVKDKQGTCKIATKTHKNKKKN